MRKRASRSQDGLRKVSRRDALKKIAAGAGASFVAVGSSTVLGGASASAVSVKRGAADEMTIVEPVEISDSLVNPGRGFATTGETYNEDITGRRHPQGGVVQRRWYWDTLEPEEGAIRYDLIDRMLAKAAANRQQLNLRVMCQNSDMRLPAWAQRQIDPPYYDDPGFLSKQANLVEALADRYDGHPHLAFVDIGTVGQWGEWHTTVENTGIRMPSRENCLKVIDCYTESFDETPLVMLIGGANENVLHYALEKGSGWRADCWGDMDEDGWDHMGGFYPEALTTSQAYDAWRSAPVALETCWTMTKWHEEGWDIDYILAWALQHHASEVNNGTEAVPEAWWPRVQAFEKKLGYRFALTWLAYPSTVPAGGTMTCTMKWENQGVAPIYRRYPLAFRFRPSGHETEAWTVETDEDIRDWMPGLSAARAELEVPAGMPPGTYDVDVGLLQPGTGEPAIELAIAGKTPGGWYPVGPLQVG